jgi:hypothetical protein
MTVILNPESDALITGSSEYRIPLEKQKPKTIQSTLDQNSQSCYYIIPDKKRELPGTEKYKEHYEATDPCWYQADPSTSRVRKNRPRDYSEGLL